MVIASSGPSHGCCTTLHVSVPLACSTCPLCSILAACAGALSTKPLYKISIISIISPLTTNPSPFALRDRRFFVDPTAALTRPADASESSPSAPFCGHLEPRPDNILLDLIHSSPQECSPESIKSPTPSLLSLPSLSTPNWRLLDCVIPTSSDFSILEFPIPPGKRPPSSRISILLV